MAVLPHRRAASLLLGIDPVYVIAVAVRIAHGRGTATDACRMLAHWFDGRDHAVSTKRFCGVQGCVASREKTLKVAIGWVELADPGRHGDTNDVPVMLNDRRSSREANEFGDGNSLSHVGTRQDRYE